MDIEQEKTSTSSIPRISDDDALALMSLLMKRGYFHENVSPIRSDNITFNCNRSSLYSKDDAMLIETSNRSYIMIDVLRGKYMEELQTKGRLTIADAAELFCISTHVLLSRVVPLILGQNDSSDKFIAVTNASGHIKEVMLRKCFQDQTKQLFSSLRAKSEKGWMQVSDAARTVYMLPTDITLIQLELHIKNQKDDSDVRILLMDNANKAIVTEKFWESMKQKLIHTLSENCDAPTDVQVMAKSNAWELNWVKQIIHDGLHVPGEFHGDMYIPRKYVEHKLNLVTTSYATNGYITSHMCYTMLGISPSQMKEYVSLNHHEESYVLLPNSVVSKDTILNPLIELANDASESKHWLDLQLHIPIELLEYETNDVQILIDTYVLSAVSGVACVRSNGALFFSDAMIQHFTKNRLVTIVNAFGITRAKDIFALHKDSDTSSKSDHLESFDVTLSGKEKRSNRKSTKSSSAEGIEVMLQEKGTFPFPLLVQALTKDYPDLLELGSSPDLLTEIVMLAFYTEALEAKWCNAIQTELQRLHTDRKTSLPINATGNAALLDDFESVESAFEDPACFAASCYMLQAKAKFVTHAMDCTDQVTDEIKQKILRDFFDGSCRDFAYRVTQYALYRNNVTDANFSFSFDTDDRTIFYAPIDVCSNSYITAHLSISPNQRDLYRLLKEELPRGIGMSLAQTWESCDYGLKSATNLASDASVNDFLDHLRDNCLTYCGLPFAIYDKKAEKKFLATRRSQLMDRFEKVKDASDALDITIMLLYQTVKNQVVSGPLLQGPILEMLLAERKLPESIGVELRALAATVDEHMTADASVLERLKGLFTTKTRK